MKRAKEINNLVIVSDLHSGCKMGLYPTDVKIPLQDAPEAGYKPSTLQKKVWDIWQEFWNEWIPEVTHGEPFAVVVNGDAIDGVHHNSITQISHNLVDQKNIALAILKPIAERCAVDQKGQRLFYMIRGTEVHSGASGQQTEEMAHQLGAKPDKYGYYSRYELFVEVGGALCHILHHIGTTSSSQHESSAINAELTRELQEAARWNERAPLIIVRSHRHRYARVSFPAQLEGKKHVEAIGFTTPAFQLKTPYAMRIAGARVSPPQIGGAIIRSGDEDSCYCRHFTRILGRGISCGVEKL